MQMLCDRVHQCRREVAAVLVLDDAQRRDDRGALAADGELRHPAIDLFARVRRQPTVHGGGPAQRSISPNTMSCVPMTATTSASMCPRTISSIDDRCAKPGARTFRRYGLLA